MFKVIKKFFLDALFPVSCLACNDYGQWLCEKCQKKLKLQEKTAAEYNLNCEPLTDIFIAGNYDRDKILSSAIKNFKYKGIRELSEALGRFLSFFWSGKLATFSLFDKEKCLELQNAILVPIPLNYRRLQERGFNQSEMLAKYLAQEFAYEIFFNLKRKNDNRHQVVLNNKRRAKNIKGVFYIEKVRTKNKEKLKQRNIIIIDDIVTSGATLREAARVLKNAGAEKVYALVLAKG
jgi:ComF family protein